MDLSLRRKFGLGFLSSDVTLKNCGSFWRWIKCILHCGIGLRLCSRMWRFEWEMSTVGSHTLTLGPRLVTLFGEIEVPIGGRTLLKECIKGMGLRVHPSPWFQFACSSLCLQLKRWPLDSLLQLPTGCLPHYYRFFSETVATNKFFFLSFAIRSGMLSQWQKSNRASIWKMARLKLNTTLLRVKEKAN